MNFLTNTTILDMAQLKYQNSTLFSSYMDGLTCSIDSDSDADDFAQLLL